MTICRNLIYSCSRRYSQVHNSSSLGLYSGVAVRGQGPGQGKLVIGGAEEERMGILSIMIISGDNLVKQCDVGIHVADNSAPAIRYENILVIL